MVKCLCVVFGRVEEILVMSDEDFSEHEQIIIFFKKDYNDRS